MTGDVNATADVALFISGMLASGYAAAALFFLKFWRETGDRLFAYFAAAFGLLLVQRIVLAIVVGWTGDTWWYYLIRLFAFLLIIVAILEKNRASSA
jgi:uncharacterized protein DUF5985